MIHSAIYQILSTDAPLLVFVTDKIYPILFDQEKSWPGLVYQITGGDGTPAKNEASQMDSWTLQIDAYATEPLDTTDISLAARTALENYSGTSAGIVISNIEWISGNDGYAEDPKLFRFTTKFKITVKK